jgi:signal transduction histidine kinase
VSDEGKGFDFKAFLQKKKPGRGLKSIQQELKLLGCQLEVDSTENAGARMIIQIPIGDAEPDP